MKKILSIFFLFPLINLNAQGGRITGTWINAHLYNAVRQGKIAPSFREILPRCIYVDSNNNLTIEYQFEQKSKTIPVGRIVRHEDTLFFYALQSKFEIISDSVLIMLSKKSAIQFLKINSHPIIGDGINALLRDYFWKLKTKWMVVQVKDKLLSDTTYVKIRSTRLEGKGNSPLLKHYEFTDVEKHLVGKDSLFGITFFDVSSNNMAEANDAYTIKKVGNVVFLYKDDVAVFKLIPVE